MIEAPLPENEEARLAALRSYDILDTPAEEAFDDLTRVAARICGSTIALVSLVDAHRQWFKSSVGLDAAETPRELAFCSHAILDPGGVMVVEDATKDPRFRDNPLVTGAPNVLFYAGAPLVTPDGLPLGTLCVIDSAPRSIDPESLETLRSLARATVTQFELRKTCAELHTTSRNLARSNSELEARTDEIRRFYQTLSHELKTPLTIVREYVSMVIEGLAGEIQPEQRRFLSVGVENCDRLARSVDDVLDLTRIETCKFRLTRGSVSAPGLLESVVEGLKPSAARAELDLLHTIEDGLPDIVLDEDRVVQVLNNLIRNSIKFTPAGGKIEVSVRRSVESSGFLEFAVSDTGRGIPSQDLGRIFDRLFQTRDEDCSSQNGLGLGLNLAREIVRLHGGEIFVDSIEGEGTTFRFLLPIDGDNADECGTEVPEELVR